MKRNVMILLLACARILFSCKAELAVPAQPDFIRISLEEPYTIMCGQTFELSVPEVAGAEKYIWTLPEMMVIVGEESGRKITVAGTVEGVIQAGMISVVAVNASGQSYSRKYWRDIKITGLPPEPDYVGISVTGSLAVNHDEEFYFIAKEDDEIVSWTWAVPENMTIVSGQGTRELLVKVPEKSVMIPAESVSVNVKTAIGLSQTFAFRYPVVVLPIDDHHSAKRFGDKVWMTRNLNYAGADGNVGIVRDDDPDGTRFGRYYTWDQAMTGLASGEGAPSFNDEGIDAMGAEYKLSNNTNYPQNNNVQIRGICPEGWHIPNPHDYYDLISGVANDYGLWKKSIADCLNDKEGVCFSRTNMAVRGRLSGGVNNTGMIGSYLRGSTITTDGGLWNNTSAQQKDDDGNWTIRLTFADSSPYHANSGQYFPMYLRSEEVGFNLIPGGYYSTSWQQVGNYSYHWTATVNASGNHLRMTLATGNCNFSTYWDAGTLYEQVRCVANYPPAYEPSYPVNIDPER